MKYQLIKSTLAFHEIISNNIHQSPLCTKVCLHAAEENVKLCISKYTNDILAAIKNSFNSRVIIISVND